MPTDVDITLDQDPMNNQDWSLQTMSQKTLTVTKV